VRSAERLLGGRSAIANERGTCVAAPQEVRLNRQVDSHHRTHAVHLLTRQTRRPILGTKRASEKRRRTPSRGISARGGEQPNSSSGKSNDGPANGHLQKNLSCVL
jgi:hypothetical protein